MKRGSFPVALFSALILLGCAAENTSSILSRFGSMIGVGGGPRGDRHRGVDFDGSRRDPVLAAADGVVTRVQAGCLDLRHTIGDRSGRTRYCHLDETHVWSGQRDNRGAVVGTVGNTGFTTVGDQVSDRYGDQVPFADGLDHALVCGYRRPPRWSL